MLIFYCVGAYHYTYPQVYSRAQDSSSRVIQMGFLHYYIGG